MRDADGGSAVASPPAVTSFSASAPAAVAEPALVPPTVPATTGRGGVAAGADPVPDAELSGFAERIYEHLARRLRAELLADRERRGLLADPL
ncbi:hypothetical protein [Frankia gtarii]|nr:hypothetical protein [Frankia gtarii]